MKAKRIISALLALMLAVCCALPSYAASAPNAAGVNKIIRTVDGIFENAQRFIRSKLENRKNYADYTELCSIPETENGYVPQGYCLSEDGKTHIISYYHGENASILAFVNAETSVTEKVLSLKTSGGKDFTGHAGGIAQENGWLYVCYGSKIYRIAMADINAAENGGEVALGASVQTDVKCSYINSDGEYLYAGEFYTFDFNGGYDTDESHHVSVSFFERSYSRCNAYKLSDFEAAFDGSELVPEFVLTTPNRVQGFARLADGSFALSTSFGRNNDSFMLVYEDVTAGESDFEIDFGGKKIPAYHLKNSRKTATLREPPMLEGIDASGDKVLGIFESGAEKYSDSAFVVNSICEFIVLYTTI